MVPAFLASSVDLKKRWEELVGAEGSCELEFWPEFQNMTADVMLKKGVKVKNYQAAKYSVRFEIQFINDVVLEFNYGVKYMMEGFMDEFPNATLTFCDVFQSSMDIMANRTRYGFETVMEQARIHAMLSFPLSSNLYDSLSSHKLSPFLSTTLIHHLEFRQRQQQDSHSSVSIFFYFYA